MSNRLPLSVHVLTWNSGKTLHACLASVADIASEILVIDGGSTDDTLAIAKEFGANILRQGHTAAPIRDFSAVRNQALEAATQPWILALDSDESASEELQQEIRESIEAGKPIAALVPRKYVLQDGRIVRLATTYPNARIYFFHRDTARKWIKPVHERPLLKEGTTIVTLHGASLAPLGTIAECKERNRRYLAIERERSRADSFGTWLRTKLVRTLLSRGFALIKLLGIWLLPRRCPRLPLRFELLRLWYGWRVIVETFPQTRR